MALILTVATVLRVRDLDRYSLWYDEVVTMRLARTSSPAALVQLLDQIDGTRAPLHPLLLQGWLRLFGSSELAGRSFSATCGVFTVLLVYLLGRRLIDDATGRWGAWLAAVCPPLVYYSQEARMYAWLVVLTCLSWLQLIDFRTAAGRQRRTAYWLILTALFYSHPLGAFMVAAHGMAYLLVRKSLALEMRSWLAIQVAVLVAISPWLRRCLDHGTDYPLPRYSIRFLLAVPIEYVGGNSIVLLACALVIAIGLFSWAGRRPGLIRPASSMILLVWTIVPPVLIYTCSRIGRPIFGPPRYHLFIAPAYLILLAQGLTRLRPALRWGLGAGALYLSLSMIEANVYSQVVKADWRGLARWLGEEQQTRGLLETGGPSAVIVYPSDRRFPRDQVEAARYYLCPPHRVLLAESAIEKELIPPQGQLIDVYCLSALQVREGVRDLTDAGFPRSVWRRTDPPQGMPEFYGLIVRRRRPETSALRGFQRSTRAASPRRGTRPARRVTSA
jgi:uncharacterized membrane protein